MSAAPPPVAVFEEFLAPLELGWVHGLAMDGAARFQGSQVMGGQADGICDPDYRRSRVLYDLGYLHELMGRRLFAFLPHIFYRLGVAPFVVSQVELQLTSSANGDFFRAHTDSDDGPVSSRTVTFVLFCHREPRRFSGGELHIYGTDPASGTPAREQAIVFAPAQNRMILFRSETLHEIMPVACPSVDLPDTRLTLNGWLHR